MVWRGPTSRLNRVPTAPPLIVQVPAPVTSLPKPLPSACFALLPTEVWSERTHLGDGKLKYPKWQREFQETILEFDQDKLPEKAKRFENAVLVRLQELASDSDHHDEREAIADATTTISVLKKYKLSDPDSK